MSKLYKIIGYEHSSEITYYHWDTEHKFPKRDLIKESERGFIQEFNSMDEASLWLITFHPELYM